MFIQHSSTSTLLILYNDYSIYKTCISRVINLRIVYLWQCKFFCNLLDPWPQTTLEYVSRVNASHQS